MNFSKGNIFYNKIRSNLFIISLISFLWFLMRTGENPSRAVYPCQRVALTQFSIYAICVIPMLGLKKFVHFIKDRLSWQALFRPLIFSLIIAVAMISFSHLPRENAMFSNKKKLGVNNKHGVLGLSDITGFLMPPASAQSIGPRVVSVHDSNASNWNHATGQHWEYIDQNAVNNMFAVGLMALTRTTNTIDAWKYIIPYHPGDEVAIKFNFNNSPSCRSGNDYQLDGLSETANAIIDGLISIGVPPGNIWIYDAMRRVIPTRFISRVANKNVKFFGALEDGACAPNYYQTRFVDPGSPDVSGFTCQRGTLPQDVIRPARVLVDAEHLINVPIFRSHGGMASFALKNHYGSVFYNLNDQNSMHSYFNPLDNQWGCDLNTENILADINNNPHIRNKTRLIIGEGIFGHSWNNMESPIPYVTFNNDDPNIYFFGFDPIAVSSVMADSLNYERSRSNIPEAHWPDPVEHHEQLHAGALLGLGIHEHWDNPVNQRYLNINYIKIDLDSRNNLAEIAAFHLSSDQFFSYDTGNLGQYGWGGSDCYPLVWDYNGDGIGDTSIYHIPTNQWFVKGYPGDNMGQFGWGQEDCIPIPGDYNGDGTMERAFYHTPSNTFFIEGQGGVTQVQFGWNGAECIPVPGDYDGDGTTDLMIYHIPTNQWLMHGIGNLGRYGWNGAECIPVPADYDGNGSTDIAVYHYPTNQWFVKGYPGDARGQYGWGGMESFPIPGDYNGDRITERGFYRHAENWWFIEGRSDFVWGWGGQEFVPITSQMAVYNWFRFMLGKFR